MFGGHTDACILVLGFLEKVVCVKVGNVAELFGLVLVDVDGVLIQHVLNDVLAELIVLAQSVKMAKGLCPSSQVVVDLEVLSELGKLLKLSQEREVFPRVLDFVR